jgi:hypothetical protein
MKTGAKLLSMQLLALPLCLSVAFAQVTELGPVDQSAPAQGAPAQATFSQQELDQMLAPIALYPDALLSQILMASTYPIEVVQAARWSRANPGLNGDQAVQAVEQQNWDPSVKSLVAFPQIISMMDEKLDWMERLGDAFLSQQQQVMDTVQGLRQKAQLAGNLQSNENVRVEPQGQTIVIEQANPQVVYVPYYNPTVVYGPWWYPEYPPVYWGPWPGYYARPGFGVGFFWGAGIAISTGFFFGAFDWPHHHVSVLNVNNYYYRPPTRVVAGAPGGWYHDPVHRRGVPYRDPVLRQEFARPGARIDARREFRGNDLPRIQRPGAPVGRPEGRDSPANRPEPRANNNNNVRPNVPDAGRPEPRNIARPNAGNVPRPNVPGVAAPQVQAPRVRNLPAAPAVAGPQVQAPRVSSFPAAPARPAAVPRPHVFEGVGQGPAVRDSSQRGNVSSQRMAPPPRPAAQQQRAAPAQRPAAEPRQSGGAGGGRNEGQQRQQR